MKKPNTSDLPQTSLRHICGIVMPISAIDDCSELHWEEVREILIEAILGAGFEPNLVSNADDVGTIQKRIVQNLYDNPVVVCDISGKNPNVMFELGLRLAFDKPTVIVKDDVTPYSFDTSVIEHLEYPRTLGYPQIVEFKEKLTAKIKATDEKATNDPGYSTFLKHFGEFKKPQLEEREVSSEEFILEELQNLRLAVQRLGQTRYALHEGNQIPLKLSSLDPKTHRSALRRSNAFVDVPVDKLSLDQRVELQEYVGRDSRVKSFTVDPRDEVLTAFLFPGVDRTQFDKELFQLIRSSK
jgi:hypothetical protein